MICSSCATVLNSRTKRIDILTISPARIVLIKDTLVNYHNRTEIQVPRDIEPLKLIVFNDSISKEIIIDSRNSFAYWFNIYANCGIGMLIDKDKLRRYSYPNRVYVNVVSSNDKPFTLYNPIFKKGDLQWHISLPYVNNFILRPTNENDAKINTGFWGLTTGLDYYYKDNQFLNISLTGVLDFFLPVIGAVDISGEYDSMSSVYISFSNNYRINRFSTGYGLSFSRNQWAHNYSSFGDSPPPVREPVTKGSYSIGLFFPIYMQAGEYFNIGLIYRPSFFKIQPAIEFKYEHLISIDLAWKIPLIKK